MEASKRLVEEQKDSELLPGIPHDITLCIVIPNLSWRDLRTLFSVSPIWQHEIQSRQVYDIRRCTQSTEDLAVISHYYPGRKSGEFGADHDEDIQAFSLYSVRDKCCYDLPTIPFPEGIRIGSQFIAMDGEIYILGGRTPMGASREVYVLDVAGQQTEWRRCASMHEPRLDFGVGVLNGKIYVFGGDASILEPVLGCEVYDPKLNKWSSIAPLTEGRIFYKVAVIGEELYVYGGDRTGLPRHNNLFNAGFPDIYHPSKNEWRQMKSPDFKRASDDIFVARGKFHALYGTFMEAYNSDKGLWNFEQSCASIPSLVPIGLWNFEQSCASIPSFVPFYMDKHTIALGDELLVVKYDHKKLGFGSWVGSRVCLYQSTGFGKNANIVWEKANCFPNTFGELGFLSLRSPFLCSIQL